MAGAAAGAPFRAERCPPRLATLPPGPASSRRAQENTGHRHRDRRHARQRIQIHSHPSQLPFLPLFFRALLAFFAYVFISSFMACAAVNGCSFRLRNTRRPPGSPARRGCACARPLRSAPRREARASYRIRYCFLKCLPSAIEPNVTLLWSNRESPYAAGASSAARKSADR